MKKNIPKKIKINYIRWERSDAIGKVTSNCIKSLKNKVNLNVITLKTGGKNKFSKRLKLLQNIAKLSKVLLTNELIHIEEPKNLESLVFLFFNSKKSVLTVHHLDEINKNSISGRLSLYKDRKKHNSFSKLIAISEKTKMDLVKEYGINPSKITVIPHGIDKKIFKPTKRKIDFIKHKKYILYLGSEIPRKNIRNLLKAFKEISIKHPNLILVKGGYSGGEEYRENTEKLIKEMNLKGRVVFISKRIKEEDLPSYYSNAELFVYPTLKEGFGMPLVEAMACGCPVVTSDIAPMKDIARGQVLVNPYNTKNIAQGMNKILSNKEYKKVLRKRGIKRSKDFDWKKSANEIIGVYKELENEKYLINKLLYFC